MNMALQKMGETIYKTGLKKTALIEMIAEMNGVAVRTVYDWLAKGGDMEAGRVIASLNDIIEREGKK